MQTTCSLRLSKVPARSNVVVAVSAFMLLLPIEGEPNFGPGKDAAALEEGVDLHGDEQIASS